MGNEGFEFRSLVFGLRSLPPNQRPKAQDQRPCSDQFISIANSILIMTCVASKKKRRRTGPRLLKWRIAA